jgi:hypothetical protein
MLLSYISNAASTTSWAGTAYPSGIPEFIPVFSRISVSPSVATIVQTSYDQNNQLILKSYLPVVYGTPLNVKETR